MKEIIHKLLEIEFVRFAIVGIIATALHYGVYLLLLWLHSLHFSESILFDNAAYFTGYAVGFVCNMWLSARFTFKTELTVKRGGGFILTNLVNYGLHVLFLNLFLWFGLSSQWAPIPTYCLVVPINFILVRTVFKKLK